MKNGSSTTTSSAKVRRVNHFEGRALLERGFNLLSICWKGIVFYELFPKNRTIRMCTLCKLNAVIYENRPELVKDVIFHHDNANPHTYLQAKLLKLYWDTASSIHQTSDITYFAPFLRGKNKIAQTKINRSNLIVRSFSD